ncbi:MAG: YceI family protein [Terriglobia bacterium]
MNKKVLTVFLLFALPQLLRADSQWVLAQSTLTYHISHPLHSADGVSHAARGKGICHSGQCNFLVAVPVKSFDSGNSNRDLHMLEVVRGAQFPMIIVRFQLPDAALSSAAIHADLEIQFDGQTAQYKQVPFQRVIKGNETEVTGTIPLKISDFKIPAPSLLDMPIKNDVPVRVDTTWRRL